MLVWVGGMSGESSLLCVCRWRALLCTISKPVPQASSSHTLPYYSFALPVLAPQGSTSAYHVVALCASAHRMSRDKWQHRANVPISGSERSTSKCKPIMWCATTSSTGFQKLRSVGPSSSEDEPQSLRLKPLAHMRKQCCCGEAHGSQIATGRCQNRLNFIRQIPVTPTAQAPIWDTTVQQVSQRCAHSLCELQVLLKLFNPAYPMPGNCEIDVCKSFQVFALSACCTNTDLKQLLMSVLFVAVSEFNPSFKYVDNNKETGAF